MLFVEQLTKLYFASMEYTFCPENRFCITSTEKFNVPAATPKAPLDLKRGYRMKNWIINKGSVIAITAILSIATAVFIVILGTVHIADRIRSLLKRENDEFVGHGRVSSEYVP